MSTLKYVLSKNSLLKNMHYKKLYHHLSSNSKKHLVMGIETSCDDTGCAIVDNNGNIIGEAINSQQTIHLNNGGIIPPVAQLLHRQHIEKVVNNALKNANVSVNDLDAIATTTKPGMPLSLLIGTKYGKYLAKMHNKPFIPIHHMEAHALTIRMQDKSVRFPFLVLLISGGHCLLAVVKSVDDYLLLGQSLDDAPGEALDKTARRLKLRNISEFFNLSGGQAIELAASRADNILEFEFNSPLTTYKDCNFSFAGLKNKVLRHTIQQEKLHEIEADGVIPKVYNLCAGFQLVIARHLCQRTQRAMEYVELKQLIPQDNLTLVVSGGVACNNFIAKALQIVCNQMGYRLARPTPKLCTDNGIMIAWNGMERWLENKGIVADIDSVDIEPKAILGKDISKDVAEANLKCSWVKLTELTKGHQTNNIKIAQTL